MPISDPSIKFWLALVRTSGIGSRTFLHLLDEHDPENIFSLSHASLSKLGLKNSIIDAIKAPDWEIIESDLAWLKKDGNHAITLHDNLYPELLKQIDDPPPVLFVRGNPSILSSPQIAIVGSRNPSALGQQTAIDFALNLARQGLTITSGLALGIDAASHQGALQADGLTIAVAGTGLDRIYPARNKDLANRILEQGAIVSELPPGTPAKTHHFPRRNRIISGMSMGLLVVEAARQSGSLITARLALESNREVFAIPGSIHNPLARGCNALIKEGAKLVENLQDIFDELNFYNQTLEEKTPENEKTTLDLKQQNLLNLIMFSPTSVDWLVKESGLSVEVISSTLLLLELQGYIENAPGGYMRVK